MKHLWCCRKRLYSFNCIKGSGGSGVAGDVLSITGNNHDTIYLFRWPSTTTLKFDFKANFASHVVKIIATVTRSTVSSKSKTLNTAQTKQVSTEALATARGGVNIGKADVFDMASVHMADFSTMQQQVIQMLQIDMN